MITEYGNRYGRLLVLSEATRLNKKRRVLCVCDCGKTKEVLVELLRNGKTTSCGCRFKEMIIERNFVHGKAESPEYRSWANMMQRCYVSSNSHYDRYGGRGIKVCERWHSAALFLQDMGERPTNRHTIERIDNDGNYEPSNCRWATREEQIRNTSRTNRIFFDDHWWCLSDLAKACKLSRSTIRNRLASGMSIEEAIGDKVRFLK